MMVVRAGLARECVANYRLTSCWDCGGHECCSDGALGSVGSGLCMPVLCDRSWCSPLCLGTGGRLRGQWLAGGHQPSGLESVQAAPGLEHDCGQLL